MIENIIRVTCDSCGKTKEMHELPDEPLGIDISLVIYRGDVKDRRPKISGFVCNDCEPKVHAYPVGTPKV